MQDQRCVTVGLKLDYRPKLPTFSSSQHKICTVRRFYLARKNVYWKLLWRGARLCLRTWGLVDFVRISDQEFQAVLYFSVSELRVLNRLFIDHVEARHWPCWKSADRRGHRKRKSSLQTPSRLQHCDSRSSPLLLTIWPERKHKRTHTRNVKVHSSVVIFF